MMNLLFYVPLYVYEVQEWDRKKQALLSRIKNNTFDYHGIADFQTDRNFQKNKYSCQKTNASYKKKNASCEKKYFLNKNHHFLLEEKTSCQKNIFLGRSKKLVSRKTMLFFRKK